MPSDVNYWIPLLIKFHLDNISQISSASHFIKVKLLKSFDENSNPRQNSWALVFAQMFYHLHKNLASDAAARKVNFICGSLFLLLDASKFWGKNFIIKNIKLYVVLHMLKSPKQKFSGSPKRFCRNKLPMNFITFSWRGWNSAAIYSLARYKVVHSLDWIINSIIQHLSFSSFHPELSNQMQFKWKLFMMQFRVKFKSISVLGLLDFWYWLGCSWITHIKYIHSNTCFLRTCVNKKFR